MDNVLVTGADGFIGSHLAETLLKAGAKVRVLDNMSGRKGANVAFLKTIGPGRLEVVEDDIRSLEACRKACQGMEYVLHQAGLGSVSRSVEDPMLNHEHNATGTLNMLLAARDAGVKRFVWASSSSCYGDQDPPDAPKYEAMLPRPASPYGAAKLMGEYYAGLFHKLYGFETVSLRYFNVFGPRQDPDSEYAAVIPKFIQRLKAGKPPVIFGTGKQSRDFTYIANVVQANLKALKAPKAPGHVINVANGTTYDLLYLVATLQKILGTDIPPRFTEPRPGDVAHSLADMTRAVDLLDLRPEVGFEDGLALTVESFQD